jgi:hypothetical protein
MRGRGVVFTLAVLAASTGPASAAGASTAGASTSVRASATRPGGTVRSINTVDLSYDPVHPERAVVTSSAVFTRGAPQPLALEISVSPARRAAALGAVVTNQANAPISFGPQGLAVRATVRTGGRVAVVWTVRNRAIHSIGAGQTLAVGGAFPLQRAGTYEVVGAVTYG